MTPERTKDTGFWNDDFVQTLPPLGKLLFDYLWTNSDCNQAGLYHITLRTMAFDTGIPEDELPNILELLEPKVKWWSELNLVWVKNFVKRQTKSPTFLESALKCVSNDDNTLTEFINYYKNYIADRIKEWDKQNKPGLQRLKDLFNYCLNKVGELPQVSEPETIEEKETDVLIPTPLEIDLLEILKTIPGWQYEEGEDLAWLRELTNDHQNVTVENLKACGDYFSDKKQVTKGAFKNRIRQWLKHDSKFEKEKQIGTHRKRPLDTADTSRYTGQKYDHMVKR